MRKIMVQIISQTENNLSPSVDNGGGDNKNQPNADVSDKAKINATANLAYKITSQITSEIISAGNYYVGKYYSMTEDYKGTQNTQNTMKLIGLVTSTAGSAVGLGMAGAKFGPVGAAIGAILGASMSLTSSAISSKREYNEAMYAIHENAYSNYFYSERAGYADMGRGTND